MIGQYIFYNWSITMYTGLSLVICFVWHKHISKSIQHLTLSVGLLVMLQKTFVWIVYERLQDFIFSDNLIFSLFLFMNIYSITHFVCFSIHFFCSTTCRCCHPLYIFSINNYNIFVLQTNIDVLAQPFWKLIWEKLYSCKKFCQ